MRPVEDLVWWAACLNGVACLEAQPGEVVVSP